MSVIDPRLLHLCDGKLRTEDGYTFEVHRIRLARKSEYFCSMFHDTIEDKCELKIPGVSGRCLADILNYIYADKISVDEKNFRELLLAADYFLMKDLILYLKQTCMECITTRNCLQVFHAAYLIHNEGISGICFRYIETNFEEIIRTQMSDLAELPLELFDKILKSTSLYVHSETTVWLAIVEWLQKDIPTRMHCIPLLWTCLAAEELDEKLATEILQYKIVSQYITENSGEMDKSDEFSSNLERLSYYLVNSPNYSGNIPWSRIPTHVHVITVYNHDKSDIYITYDENADVHRKLGEIQDFEVYQLAVVGPNIFLFPCDGNECVKFDLLSQQRVPMSNFQHAYNEYCVIEIEKSIYILGVCDTSLSFEMEVYEVESDRWFASISPSNISGGDAISVNNKIYVVGNTEDSEEMTTQMFDPVTQTWTVLSPPNSILVDFVILNYREKVYLIGEREVGEPYVVEVFDPQTNLWRELPRIPFITYGDMLVLALDDQLFACSYIDEEDTSEKWLWNDVDERWEEVQETSSLLKFSQDHYISTVDDVNTLRVITKQNRDPSTKLEKNPFF